MSELTKEMPKKLGFGCMRLPVTDGSTENINDAAFCEMIDSYLEQGFKYFDTAYPYHNGRSEEAVGRCLVQRYARDRFFLASRMPISYCSFIVRATMTKRAERILPHRQPI